MNGDREPPPARGQGPDAWTDEFWDRPLPPPSPIPQAPPATPRPAGAAGGRGVAATADERTPTRREWPRWALFGLHVGLLMLFAGLALWAILPVSGGDGPASSGSLEAQPPAPGAEPGPADGPIGLAPSPDVTPPRLSNVAATPGPEGTAEVTWFIVDEGSLPLSWVEYGTTADYDHQGDALGGDGARQSLLSGLAPATTYHYRVHAVDLAGNEVLGADHAFQTHALAGPPEPSGLVPSLLGLLGIGLG